MCALDILKWSFRHFNLRFNWDLLKFSRNISIDKEVGDIQRIVWAVVNWRRIPPTSFRTTSQCLSIHKSKAGQKYTNRAIQKSTYPKNRTLWPIQLPICLQEPIVCTIVVNCQHLWTTAVRMVSVHWAQCSGPSALSTVVPVEKVGVKCRRQLSWLFPSPGSWGGGDPWMLESGQCK